MDFFGTWRHIISLGICANVTRFSGHSFVDIRATTTTTTNRFQSFASILSSRHDASTKLALWQHRRYSDECAAPDVSPPSLSTPLRRCEHAEIPPAKFSILRDTWRRDNDQNVAKNCLVGVNAPWCARLRNSEAKMNKTWYESILCKFMCFNRNSMLIEIYHA